VACAAHDKTPQKTVNMESSWNETAKLSKKHLAREADLIKVERLAEQESRSKSSSRSKRQQKQE
jgi:hypothetical protein